jgi:FO synthase
LTVVGPAAAPAGADATPAPASAPDEAALRALGAALPPGELLRRAARLRDEGHGRNVSCSRKVFIPLTRLCRDVCRYCTFAVRPRAGTSAYLTPPEVLAIARAGVSAGCKEALFTLGDKPELRYRQAGEELARLGYPSTVSYLTAMCRLVLEETGLLPHANPGVLDEDGIAALREVAASQGLMLETAAERLSERGGPHFGSPDKHPRVRLATIEAAGRLRVPFTSGILIGIGETREERLDALLALRRLHGRYGHLQEIIVQNFRAKPGTPMADASEPALDELLWTVALARLTFGPAMSIQVPPNLTPQDFGRVLDAGINDWGGISPVTIDHVNPEAPWPQLAHLEAVTRGRGKELVERLTSYPAFCRAPELWHVPAIARRIRQLTDSEGFVRADPWSPGLRGPLAELPSRTNSARALDEPPFGRTVACSPDEPPSRPTGACSLDAILERAMRGDPLDEQAVVRLFTVRGAQLDEVLAAADTLRERACGDVVRYVVNRNINYTNICTFGCRFCAFSKGPVAGEAAALRGSPYNLSMEEITRRAAEAWSRGATEVCLQGGIHPDYTGATYLSIVRAIKAVQPRLHVHAFSPLEIRQGAQTLGVPLDAYLCSLRDAGLGSLPGTAAEILDDEIRRVICPDKLSTAQWLEVMEAAARVGLRATATIMFGHVESPVHWSRHLLRTRELQSRTGVFTEFVPLPFVHMEAPLWRRGRARPGPTYREALLMHAVARLALHPCMINVQTSWVKMGPQGAQACLRAGANDLGGTLMNESISRAAGTEHGQELPPAQLDALIAGCGRTAAQRTTLYASADPAQVECSYRAAPLAPVVQTPPARRAGVRAAAGAAAGAASPP